MPISHPTSAKSRKNFFFLKNLCIYVKTSPGFVECTFNKLAGKKLIKTLKVSEQSPKIIKKLFTKTGKNTNISSLQIGGSFYIPAKYISQKFFIHQPKFYCNSLFWNKLLSSENSFLQVEFCFCNNAQIRFKNPTFPLKTREQINQIT